MGKYNWSGVTATQAHDWMKAEAFRLAKNLSTTAADPVPLDAAVAELGALVGDVVNVKSYGARGDSLGAVITLSDRMQHPEWIGTYYPGVDTWDFVGIQEAIYAAWATASTPGTFDAAGALLTTGNIIWNGELFSKRIWCPQGEYFLNRALLAVAVHGASLVGAGRFSTKWIMTGGNESLLRLDGFSYSSVSGISFEATFRQRAVIKSKPFLDADWFGSGLNDLRNVSSEPLPSLVTPVAVASAQNPSVTISTAAWQVNQWRGCTIVTDDVGNWVGGQVRRVVANNATTLFVDEEWHPEGIPVPAVGGAPATRIYAVRYEGKCFTGTGGTQIKIKPSDANWAPNQWAQKKVYIVRGGGTGQQAVVVSNTSDTLTLGQTTNADENSQFFVGGYAGQAFWGDVRGVYMLNSGLPEGLYQGKRIEIVWGSGYGAFGDASSQTSQATMVSSWTGGTPARNSWFVVDGVELGLTSTAQNVASLSVAGTPWAANAYLGGYVEIVEGTGIGQRRAIRDSTTNTLSFADAPGRSQWSSETWDVLPDATSKFVIRGRPFWASAHQSSKYSDLYFYAYGSVGLCIARSGDMSMGSENLIENCYAQGMEWAGAMTNGLNALQNTFLGGNYAGCSRAGIRFQRGAGGIYSVGFQNGFNDQKGYDVIASNSVNDHTVLLNCRSESYKLASFDNFHAAHVSGCVIQTSGAQFAYSSSRVHNIGERIANTGDPLGYLFEVVAHWGDRIPGAAEPNWGAASLRFEALWNLSSPTGGVTIRRLDFLTLVGYPLVADLCTLPWGWLGAYADALASPSRVSNCVFSREDWMGAQFEGESNLIHFGNWVAKSGRGLTGDVPGRFYAPYPISQRAADDQQQKFKTIFEIGAAALMFSVGTQNKTAPLTGFQRELSDTNTGTLLFLGDRLKLRGVSLPSTTKTANYNATIADHTIRVNASTGPITISLPAVGAAPGAVLVIKKIDALGNHVTIVASSPDLIDGSPSISLASQFATVRLQCNGTSWDVI